MDTKKKKKKNQQKVKSTRDKVKRNPDKSVQESLPSGVIQILIPSASSCDSTCTEPSIRQTLERLCAQGFIKDWSHGHRQPLPKFQTPRSKTGALHKPHCLHKKKQAQRATLLLGREWWEQKSKLPNTSQGTTLQTVLSK